MIVVDSNVLAYFYLPGPLTSQAVRLQEQDPAWAAPMLWRSEFRNILAHFLRSQRLALDEVFRIQAAAESLMAGREFELPSIEVLSLVAQSGCSAYDCEFIALAKELDVLLVTADRQVLREFPEIAMRLQDAVA